jgi:signal transduction histidine kinase/Tfp pilus assembly protein PilF
VKKVFLTLYLFCLCFNFTLANLIDSLETLVPKTQGIEKVDILLRLAHLYQAKDKVKTRYFIEEARAISQNLHYEKGLAGVHKEKGNLYFQQGTYRKALEFYNRALQLNSLINDQYEVANCLSNIGLVYKEIGDYFTALEYFYKTIKLDRELNNEYGLACTLDNLGNVFAHINAFEKALNYYLEALNIREKINHIQGVALTSNNLGLLYFHLKDYEKAQQYLSRSLDISKKTDDKKGMANAYCNIGKIQLETGRPRKAIDYLWKSAVLQEEMGNKSGLCDSYNNLSRAYLTIGKTGSASEFLNDALALAKSINSKLWLKNTYYNLYKLQEKQMLFHEAIASLHKSYIYKDSIFNERNMLRIGDLQTKHEIDKKERQIQVLKSNQEISLKEKEFYQLATIGIILIIFIITLFIYSGYVHKKRMVLILEKKNTEIELQKAELQKLNTAKDRFFSIISHDIKSPLNTLNGFLNILIKQLDKSGNNDLKVLGCKIESSLKSIAGFLDNLLKWSGSQLGTLNLIPENLNLHKIVKSVFELYKLNAESKELTLENHIQPDVYVYADDNALETIVRNLVYNAIKFTPKGGMISIHSFQTEDFIEICVKDTGIGMADEVRDNLFSLEFKYSGQGTDNESGTGLGLILCKEFVEKQGGKISVDSLKGKGCTFSFTIPAGKKSNDVVIKA